MTFTSGGGDNYRPGGGQQGRSNPEFTFSSNHDGPRFPPAGPANAGPPARRRDQRNGGPRDSRRGGPNGRGRGGGRGGYRKPGAHERALLTVQDRGSPERTLGVADGSNKFMNVDEMAEEEEEDTQETGEDAADAEDGTHKVARTASARADGDSVPKWSNPEIYSALPPPEELRPGKKIDFVQLIRKAKNDAAEKGDSNNAVVANDDFISFGDDDASTKGTDVISLDDDEPRTNKRPQNGGFVQGPMSDLDYVDSAINQNRRPQQATDLHEQPRQSKAKRKRGEMESVRGIVQEWMGTARCDTAPWLDSRQNYAHLVNDPLKW
jgi:non-canonical poly(A) RNA polymerase PAPD5/7